MNETIQFSIGTEIVCSDGVCGDLTRIVVDPVARAVTHLVVEPKHRQGLGRLVPLELIDVSDGRVELRCTLAEFEKLDDAEETRFVSWPVNNSGYGPGQLTALPYYELGTAGGMGLGSAVHTEIYDSLPLGEVAVRRGEHVHATDGEIGQVEGLVIEPESHHMTHVLLQEGHLWGRRQVAIPITAVISVDDGIRLNITKQAVQQLPPIDVAVPDQ